MIMPLVVGSKCDPYLGRNLQRDLKLLAKIGEDPMDIGGYLIINGSERVVVPREEAVRGRILIEELSGASPEAKKYKIQAWLVSPGTYRNRIDMYMGRDDLKLYVKFTRAGVKEPIPLILLVRALGLTIREFVMFAAPDEFRGESKYGDLITTVIQLSIQGIPPEALRDPDEALFQLAKYMSDFRIPITQRRREQVIQEVKNMGHGFVMPVKKYDRVKEMMETVYTQGPQRYEMSKGTIFTLVVVKDEDSGKLLPYATNLDGVQPTVIHTMYMHRFGIETQYRLKNQFLGRTCSKQYSVRYAFFILAVALYNLWVLLNILERGRQGLEPGKIPIKVDQLKHIFRKIIYRNAPV